MHIGISIPTGPVDPVALRTLLAAADQLGYHSVWVPSGDGSTDPLAVVGVVIGATRRVRVATDSLVAQTAAPGQAKTLAVLHELSDHRLVLGLRGTAGAELTAIAGLAADVAAESRPSDRPTVLVSGDDVDVIEFVVRSADGWIAEHDDAERIRATWDSVLARAAAVGRDPDELALVARTAARGGCRVSVLRRLEQAGVHEVVIDTEGVGSLDRILEACAAVAEELSLEPR